MFLNKDEVIVMWTLLAIMAEFVETAAEELDLDPDETVYHATSGAELTLTEALEASNLMMHRIGAQLNAN